MEVIRKTTGSVRWVPREEWEPAAIAREEQRQQEERAAWRDLYVKQQAALPWWRRDAWQRRWRDWFNQVVEE